MEIGYWLILAICLVLVLAVLFRDRLLRLLQPQGAPPPYPLRHQDLVDQELGLLRKLPPSPLTRLSFSDAMASSERFGTQMETFCNESLSQVLTGDGTNIAVQSLLLSSNELTLVYKFSDAATRLYETGQATIPLHTESGRLLPWMVDKSGRIIEQAKGANMLAARLAQSWSVIVSAAHVISCLDVVKRLKEIDRSLSMLVAGRRIDQDAQLNRIYTEARGILTREIDWSAVRELKRRRYDLYQLRQVWRGEISELIRSAGLPSRSGWHHSSWWRRGNREKQVFISLVPIADKLERLRLALLIDACLAFSSGTIQDLLENAIPSEQDFWVPLTNDVAKLTDRFRRVSAKSNVEEIRTGVDAYASVLQGMMGRKTVSVELVQ